MLKNIRSVILFALLMIACNNKPDTGKNDLSDKDSTGNDTASVIKTGIDKINRDEELQALTPLTTTDLEKLAPAELMGIARTDIISNNNVGTAMVIATYAPENSAEIRLIIMDCGGAGGAGAYNMIYANELGQDKNSETEYSKTIDFNGSKAIEQCMKPTGDCSLTWFSGKRYLVTVEGNNIDVMKKAVSNLNIQ